VKLVCFVGITITPEEAKGILDAEYFGPIKAGDIPAVIAEVGPHAIGIVDGVFHRTAAVLHKDILYALDRGIQVFGAASIGALRAAELRDCGMIGVGQVYGKYVSGELTGDDEVAVPVARLRGKGWVITNGCDALVNIRATLAAARIRGALTEEAATAIGQAAKGLCFTERRWDLILQRSGLGMSRAELTALELELSMARIDVKRADAITMLHAMSTWAGSTSDSQPTRTRASPFPPEHEACLGPFWDQSLFSRPLSLREDQGCNGYVSDGPPLLQDMLDHAVVRDLRGAGIFQDGLTRALLMYVGAIHGVTASEEQIQRCAEHLVRLNGGLPEQLTPLTNSDVYSMAREECICEKVLDHFSEQLDQGILLTLLVEGEFSALRERMLRHVEDRARPVQDPREWACQRLEADLGVRDASDYFDRFLSWMPSHRLRAALSKLPPGGDTVAPPDGNHEP
jgi:hypothetical protein